LMNGPTDAEIDHRVSALARLGTMRNELSRRVRSANRLGLAVDVSVPTPGFVDNPHVLVAGVGLGLPKIQAALGDNATVFGVPTANLALDHLENFSVDLVCIDATTRIGRSLDMISALRRMPRWCAIPIVVTVPPDTDAATCKLMHDYGATDLIGLEESDDFAANRITVLIREHRYATAIQKSFVEMGTRIKDPGTNLIGREFGLVHLMELIHDSDRHGDGLSAVGIQIHADGAAASFAKSVSGALSSTVRGEDLAVSLSPDLFLIMLPGTDAPQARVIRDRISAIIGSTDFGVDDIGLPRIAPVSYATTTYKSGDTPEIFISRLLEGFAVAERPVDRIAVQEEKARS
jgi:two-component system cell cycle response regulator